MTSLAALSSQLNVAPFPAGTRMLFQQSTAPTGWTKDVSLNDRALRVVSGAVGYGGSVSFSTLFSRTATDGTTLTVAQMPSHGHGILTGYEQQNYNTVGFFWPSNIDVYSALKRLITRTTDAAGGNGSHTHGLDLRLAYVDIIIATKD